MRASGRLGLMVVVAALLSVITGTACKPKPDPKACNIEGRTIKTAMEAHDAQEGVYPSSTDELISEGYLKDQPLRYWQIDPTAAAQHDMVLVPRPGATIPVGCTA